MTTLDELYAKMIDKASRISVDGALKAAILLDLTGPDPRRWLVTLKDGGVSIAQAAEGQAADLKVTASGDTIIKVATRQTSPVAAFMTGRIKLQGDQGLVGQLKNIWPD
jgi:putative sterol carrier protein